MALAALRAWDGRGVYAIAIQGPVEPSTGAMRHATSGAVVNARAQTLEDFCCNSDIFTTG